MKKSKILEFTCDCGVVFTRKEYQVKNTKHPRCGKECSSLSLNRATYDGKYKCNNCRTYLSEDQFLWYVDKRNKLGKRKETYCNKCRNDKLKNYREDPKIKEMAHSQHSKWRQKFIDLPDGEEKIKWLLKRLMSGYKKRAKEKKLDFNLTNEYLYNLYETQKGLCYYSNQKMNIGSDKSTFLNSLSLDRKNNKLGYIKDNVVFCMNYINTMKNFHSEEEFYNFCELILSIKNNRDSK